MLEIIQRSTFKFREKITTKIVTQSIASYHDIPTRWKSGLDWCTCRLVFVFFLKGHTALFVACSRFFVKLPSMHAYNHVGRTDIIIITVFRGGILRQIDLGNYCY